MESYILIIKLHCAQFNFGCHVNFAHDPLRSYFNEHQKNEIHLIFTCRYTYMLNHSSLEPFWYINFWWLEIFQKNNFIDSKTSEFIKIDLTYFLSEFNRL